jgi:hypothetical protein
MRAKTYKSTNGFNSPQSLSKFGIKVSNGIEIKYLGLEEFNFCPILSNFTYNNNHVAFVPCFSLDRSNQVIDKLDLFYSDATGVTLNYATLFEVRQIHYSEIPDIRKNLIQAGLKVYVENSSEFRNNYNALFDPAFKIWEKCFENNIIEAQGTEDRFVVNTFYKKVIIHNPIKRVNWSNLKRAKHIYNDQV